ncbi:hypothetical protein LPB144_10020 [Christiangramia salexigens]|uniref:Uncharacterized protein n=1 Tax=Christiangramia salexigens TaxID=1913577 RepID=A0A1L3J6G7_9FLAO|nr:hypothetical protein LPB144_10020 [Christiangramia salexigens]
MFFKAIFNLFSIIRIKEYYSLYIINTAISKQFYKIPNYSIIFQLRNGLYFKDMNMLLEPIKK